ncbi:MAG TPA: hypothetical protein VN634_03915 [Candidatus Limnocylindrales bacterium]|nr:hypothetical protein [Candidatus Limnocylindrales bacterium]
MNPTKILISTVAMVAAAATPALAEWRWVEEAPARTETHVYEERVEPDYYQQEPRTYREEQPTTYYREEHYTPVVTDREVFHDGRCQVTRTYMSDGTTSDDRICSRLMLPHEFIIDRIGRTFDHLRGFDRGVHY